MIGTILSVFSIVIVVTITFVLFGKSRSLKDELNDVIDQVNKANLYQYQFDKNNEQNIKNLEKKTLSLNSDLLKVAEEQGKINVDTKKNIQDITTKINEPIKTLDKLEFTKTNKLQLGDQHLLSGVGDGLISKPDGWLRLMDKDNKNYYGGLGVDNLYSKSTIVSDGTLTTKGGKSILNPSNFQTHFPWKDGVNYIRGDTELSGTLKIGHNTKNGWEDKAVLSTKTSDKLVGASFGGKEGWSHFPWEDQNTYIRPGENGKNILIGDWGASQIHLGKGDTRTHIRGTLHVNRGENDWSWIEMNRGNKDKLFFGSDNTNRGIWSESDRPVAIYTNGKNALQVDKNGNTDVKNDINLNKRIYFKDPSFSGIGNATNNTDSYFMEKVINNEGNSSLRVTINDDPNESLEIWGNSCATGNCQSDGAMQHKFQANGQVYHKGHLKTVVDENSRLPNGWGGGLHTWDIYANATIGVGQNGNVSSYLNQNELSTPRVRSLNQICINNTCINEEKLKQIINKT